MDKPPRFGETEVDYADERPAAEEVPVGEDEASSFKFLTTKEVATLPEPKWMIDKHLPQSSLACIFGAPGQGKSFIALDMGLSVATGQEWHGYKVERGSVVYVCGEGALGLKKRIAAWKSPFQIDPEDIYESSQFFVCLQAPHFLKGDLAEFKKAIDQCGYDVKLVILDTLGRCVGGDGDENSARDMGAFVESCDALKRALGATILIVHHSTKTGNELRGSSAFLGALDTNIHVEAEGGGMLVRCTKQKEADPFRSLELELEQVVVGADENGLGTTSCYVRKPDVSATKCQLGLAPTLVSLSENFDTYGATHSQWFEVSGQKKRTFCRNVKKLIDMGYVERESPKRHARYRLTDAGRCQVPLWCQVPNED